MKNYFGLPFDVGREIPMRQLINKYLLDAVDPVTRKRLKFVRTFSSDDKGLELHPIGLLRLKLAMLLGERYIDPPSENLNYEALVWRTEKTSNKKIRQALASDRNLRAFAIEVLFTLDMKEK